MKTNSALETAKSRRAQASTAVRVAAVSASADLLDAKACEGHVATLEKRRAGAVASNKPNSVISIDGELLRARVAVEIAASKSATSTVRHASAVAALHDAANAVTQAARAVIDSEMVALAVEFTAALDAALGIGEQLRELTLRDHPTSIGAASNLPAVVEQALSRMPRPDPLNTPLHILRNGGSSGALAKRLSDLAA